MMLLVVGQQRFWLGLDEGMLCTYILDECLDLRTALAPGLFDKFAHVDIPSQWNATAVMLKNRQTRFLHRSRVIRVQVGQPSHGR